MNEIDYVNFQTPKWCCDYMVSLIPYDCNTVLEPTPGAGNLVKSIENKFNVIAPKYFEEIDVNNQKFDCICMNPPFSPMQTGYNILYDCMKMSDNIIALMPWLTIINSEKRTADLMNFGIISITHLPRKTFPGSRVQCCVLRMKRDYPGITEFKTLIIGGESDE